MDSVRKKKEPDLKIERACSSHVILRSNLFLCHFIGDVLRRKSLLAYRPNKSPFSRHRNGPTASSFRKLYHFFNPQRDHKILLLLYTVLLK